MNVTESLIPLLVYSVNSHLCEISVKLSDIEYEGLEIFMTSCNRSKINYHLGKTMKHKVKPLIFASIAISALTVSSLASAEVILEVPSDITVLAANQGKAKLEGGLFSSTKSITLPDGENQIVFKYEASFDQGDERNFATSDAIVAIFTATDTTLTFDMPTYRNLRTAEAEIKTLDWGLVDESGKSIAFKEDKLLKDGMQIGRDYVREVEDYNRNGVGVAVIATSSQVKPVTLPAQLPAKTNNTQSNATTDSTAEEMLHFWYEKADAKTKERFKSYINQQ